jgi:hypothetical protein
LPFDMWRRLAEGHWQAVVDSLDTEGSENRG